MHRNEIYLADLNNCTGYEQYGIRPVLIVQNDRGNTHSPTTIICPLTSQQKPTMDTHVALAPSDCGIVKNSTVLCEQIRVIDKNRIKRKLGEITNCEKLKDINAKLLIALGLPLK